MNPCENCDVEEKVHVCCGRHPETGRQAVLQIAANRAVTACQYLDQSGWCKVYTQRPASCRAFFCERFSGQTAACHFNFRS